VHRVFPCRGASSVKVYNIFSSDEAHTLLECADLTSDHPYLARLREETNQELIQGCSDLADECSDGVVRTFCPVTCECDSLYSGMFQRDGCSDSCADVIQSEIAVIARFVAGVGEEDSKCVVQGVGWMERFVTELQAYLVVEGILSQSGATFSWTDRFRAYFFDQTDYGYQVEEVEVDLSLWLDTSVGEGVCDAVAFFDNFFATDLCDAPTSLGLSLGTLNGLCPKVCGLCTTDTWASTSMSTAELYETQVGSVASGLFAYNFFEPVSESFSASCGSETLATGGFGRNATFAFVSPVTQYAVLSTCNLAEWDTVLRVLDDDGNLLGENDDFDGCGLTSVLQLEFTAGQAVDISVRSYSSATGGVFTLAVTCGAFQDRYVAATPYPTTHPTLPPSTSTTVSSTADGGSTMSSTTSGGSTSTSTEDSFTTSSTTSGGSTSTSTEDSFITSSTTSGGSTSSSTEDSFITSSTTSGGSTSTSTEDSFITGSSTSDGSTFTSTEDSFITGSTTGDGSTFTSTEDRLSSSGSLTGGITTSSSGTVRT